MRGVVVISILQVDRLEQIYPRRRLEYVVAEVVYCRSPHVALVGVDEEIRLKEDLIVAPVHIRYTYGGD